MLPTTSTNIAYPPSSVTLEVLLAFIASHPADNPEFAGYYKAATHMMYVPTPQGEVALDAYKVFVALGQVSGYKIEQVRNRVSALGLKMSPWEGPSKGPKSTSPSTVNTSASIALLGKAICPVTVIKDNPQTAIQALEWLESQKKAAADWKASAIAKADELMKAYEVDIDNLKKDHADTIKAHKAQQLVELEKQIAALKAALA